MTAPKQPRAYAVSEAAEVLGISRQHVYHLLKQHDPERGGTVLEKYRLNDGIQLGDAPLMLITAESVERERARRERGQ